MGKVGGCFVCVSCRCMSCLGFNVRTIYYIYEFMGEEWSSCALNSDDDETTQFRSEIGRITCFGNLA